MSRTSNKAFFYILLFIGFVLVRPVEAQKSKSSLLWEVSGNGLETSSYLYGTIHIICPDDFEMSEPVKTAFSKTDRLALELDLSDPAEMGSVQRLMMSSEPVDYEKLLTQAQYDQLDSKLKAQMGVGMGFLKSMKPFALSSLLQLGLMDCKQPASYENSFLEMAKGAEMEVLALETAAFQMSIFDNIPVDEQVVWITDYLDNEEESQETWKTMVELYKSKDVEAIANSFDDFPEYKKYEGELLTKRNQNWIPKIEKIINESPVFIAVGAAHLGGKNGVIALLRAEGYQLTPVMH